ncbi:MAG: hypothetical protein LC797_18660 [Chloroflexi bacterium]|nr:hypothetical protein [Chloroflexota bacterium]
MSLEVASPSPHTTARGAPYVGPRSFTRDDEREGVELYGRGRDLTHLVDLLISKRIVLLHSPSGAGKTSLIQAKLITTLTAEEFQVLPVVRVGPEPHVVGMSSTELRRANRYVLSTLQCLESALPEGRRLPERELLDQNLQGWFDRNFSNDATRFPFLIFDQFEEVLTADPTDRDAKVALLRCARARRRAATCAGPAPRRLNRDRQGTVCGAGPVASSLLYALAAPAAGCLTDHQRARATVWRR